MLHSHIQVAQRVCLAKEPDPADLQALGNKDRWLVYRSMVRKRLQTVIHAALPRTRKALGDALLDEEIADWLDQPNPHTRYYYDVPVEFVAWFKEKAKAHSAPWLYDLLLYENGLWEAKHSSSSQLASDFTFDRVPVLNSSVRVLRLGFPVHEQLSGNGYLPQGTSLCVYRNAAHEPITMKLNSMAAELIEVWMRGDRTVTESVQMLTRNAIVNEAFIEKLSSMVADFLERGILLGCQPP